MCSVCFNVTQWPSPLTLSRFARRQHASKKSQRRRRHTYLLRCTAYDSHQRVTTTTTPITRLPPSHTHTRSCTHSRSMPMPLLPPALKSLTQVKPAVACKTTAILVCGLAFRCGYIERQTLTELIVWIHPFSRGRNGNRIRLKTRAA